jgi:hypothetical protein
MIHRRGRHNNSGIKKSSIVEPDVSSFSAAMRWALSPDRAG